MEYRLQPAKPPPTSSIGWLAWLRANLFSSLWSGIATLLVAALSLSLLIPFLDWALIEASWQGSDRSACSSEGACWVFIVQRLDQFLYGFYPEQETWRLDLSFMLVAVALLWLAIPRMPAKRYVQRFSLLILPIIVYLLLRGGVLALTPVETHLWGGFSLTLVIAAVGIMTSLPIGILLALGRRSELPMLRSVCVVYIELWRGVPLITVLFMASVMLPLFLPAQLEFDKLLRALIGITLFQSAYMAEVVRGGLQAIPRGQIEAAQSLGLNYWKTMRIIVLPQALKLMIPGIVNTFIALFKDTSLVLIIGLFDLLAIMQAASNDPQWIGYATEGYLFVGMLFWLFCFGMSRYSQYLERRLQTDHTAD